jgi:hypothetical protein
MMAILNEDFNNPDNEKRRWASLGITLANRRENDIHESKTNR